MTKQLGKALGIIYKAEMTEEALHADVDAYYAPSECHDLVSHGEHARFRQARRHAKAVSGLPYKALMKEAKRRGLTRRSEDAAKSRILYALLPR